ncbi:MAG: S46 family peptidase [Tannerellaceae bacterium]|nr:S46 family peptidase [Tannerellaceae bacterium]
MLGGIGVGGVREVVADEGMWVLQELSAGNRERMKDLGWKLDAQKLYSQKKGEAGLGKKEGEAWVGKEEGEDWLEEEACLANAVVIFGGGCTGVTVSKEGLVFTNHHCGFGAIQQLSSVERNLLRDGFVSQSKAEELAVPELTVRYLRETVDVSEQIAAAVVAAAATEGAGAAEEGVEGAGAVAAVVDEGRRMAIADSVGKAICDSVGKSEFKMAKVVPFYHHNKYYLVVYDVFKDIRLVFTPPTAVGKFGGDTDNWMWPRHTGDVSIFRVYADSSNAPAEYAAGNVPYSPKFVAEVSRWGYGEEDFAMTIGFPGSTDRYLCSWGVKQRIESVNKPRIAVRGVKQEIWRGAMRADEGIRIKYAAKYAGSSNYWKNAIGMNRGIANLDVMKRKKSEEAEFAEWLKEEEGRQGRYGEVPALLKDGYGKTKDYVRNLTYLTEAFSRGAEIVHLADMVRGVDVKGSSTEEIDEFVKARIVPFFKDYAPDVDRQVLAAMMRMVRDSVDKEYVPDIFEKIDKKYKGNYERYAADVFRRTALLSVEGVERILKEPKRYGKLLKDPAAELSLSVMLSIYELQGLQGSAKEDISKGERLYYCALREMYPDRLLSSDANSTMRMSYGTIGGYRPFDAGWYSHYTTQRGLLEKYDPASDEFDLPEDILSLVRNEDFGNYANARGDLQLCFLTNNDITGGNSGSPVFDGNGRLIGLAFDGNWEAMSGDIAFEPELQRCIAVDIRYVLFLIEKWGKCSRLIEELNM